MAANELPHIRLAHFIAKAGVCSRRQASRLISQQRVTVNDAIGAHHQRVSADSQIHRVRVDGNPITIQTELSYWLFHKPVGIDCRLREDDPTSLIHHLPTTSHCYPVGRLDKDSRGLLLITNDGELTQRLLHPDYAHQKRYCVSVDRPITQEFITGMANGVDYGEGMTRTCHIEKIADASFRITLTEGKKRQIRRMCRHLGFRVIDLMRTHIGDIALGDLPEHSFRILTLLEKTNLTLMKTLSAKDNECLPLPSFEFTSPDEEPMKLLDNYCNIVNRTGPSSI